MSLRADVHAAFDAIAPSTGGMADRVVETARAEARPGGRRNTFMLRMRAPMSLVAVFVVIALVVLAFVAGRVVQDWNLHHNSTPAGGISWQQQVADLEQRPLVLPVLSSADACPDSGSSNGFGYGKGPVFLDGGRPIDTPWGSYFDVTWYTARSLTGPVLIRGRDIKGGDLVVFVGQYVFGRVLGTDNSSAKVAPQVQWTELLLDAGHPASRGAGYGIFKVRQGIAKDWTHCAGFQIDGPGFTETITTIG